MRSANCAVLYAIRWALRTYSDRPKYIIVAQVSAIFSPGRLPLMTNIFNVKYLFYKPDNVGVA